MVKSEDLTTELDTVRILLVEDNEDDALLLRENLSEDRCACFDLVHAGRLSTALERLAERDIDVVLLDLGLPDSQGLDSLKEINSKYQNVPIIVLTGLSDESLGIDAVRMGAQDYLVKGQVSQSLLIRAVRYSVERKRVEELLRKSLREKEILLKEIHHRVKNNMQVISSLLSLQSKHIKDEEALKVFKENQDRVRTMALIHEKLYGSKDLSRIDFSSYMRDLAYRLYHSYGINPEEITLDVRVDDVPLGVDMAIPCGLIVNELISNSLKYAFPPKWKGNGKIGISLQQNMENEIELIVSDNGIGLPEDLDIRGTQSFGLFLVVILAEDQLGGKLKFERNGGTKFHITFKEDYE